MAEKMAAASRRRANGDMTCRRGRIEVVLDCELPLPESLRNSKLLAV
ncbi:hypothetical protein ROS217_06274 [Roseovarius sp. 217]|nr:hypothetical protein ROS217_06274 [Roseovarius sp. 217]